MAERRGAGVRHNNHYSFLLVGKNDAGELARAIALKKRWSYFIRKVYETDPLTCPKCQGEMRIISFIDQPEVIKRQGGPKFHTQ